MFEGELGIVIGRECRGVDAAGAAACIFGYTCVNDVTAVGILGKDPSFPQWTRAKSFDTFGVFGPTVATGLDPLSLVDPHRAQRSGAAELPGHGPLLPRIG